MDTQSMISISHWGLFPSDVNSPLWEQYFRNAPSRISEEIDHSDCSKSAQCSELSEES